MGQQILEDARTGRVYMLCDCGMFREWAEDHTKTYTGRPIPLKRLDLQACIEHMSTVMNDPQSSSDECRQAETIHDRLTVALRSLPPTAKPVLKSIH